MFESSLKQYQSTHNPIYMCLPYQIQKKSQINPMLHGHHGKRLIKKRVSFSTKRNVYLYLDASQNCSVDTLCKQPFRVKDPLPRERRMQQLLSRRAVLSFQRHLRSKVCCNDQHRDDRLAEISKKFSQRAKDLGQEIARLNYLEVHKDPNDGKRPRYSSELNLKADVPVKVSEFPVVKLIQRQPLARRKSSGDLYQRR